MQFAGGKSIAEVAAEWETEPGWVEAAVRRALLESIPRWSGGLKATRTQKRERRRLETDEDLKAIREAQRALEW
jgi:hypothetical protein